ncbi:MAG: pilus assembly protein TadG-related protein [Aestuariivirga sp.]
MFRKFVTSACGATAVTFAMLAPAIIAAVGIASDSATYVLKHSNLQSATDAAALAAAKELSVASITAEEIEAVARGAVDAALGEDAADTKVAVTVDKKESTVEVVLAETWTPMFAHFVKSDVTPIKASATARLAGAANVCILALDKTLENGVFMNKNARVAAKDCGIFTNSTHSNALRLEDNTSVEADLICSAGGVKANPGSINPTPTSDCPQIPDPLASREPPSFGACNHFVKIIVSGTHTLNPGVYCGGLNIGGNAKVTLNPGIYIIKDGTFTVTLNAQLKGTNVGFYLTGPLSLIAFSQNTVVELTGPKDGPMAGLLFFEDRNAPFLRMHWINSANARKLTGTIYLPKGYLLVDPNTPIAQDSEYTAIITNRLEVREGPLLTLNADYDATDVPVPAGIRASAQVVLTK